MNGTLLFGTYFDLSKKGRIARERREGQMKKERKAAERRVCLNLLLNSKFSRFRQGNAGRVHHRRRT